MPRHRAHRVSRAGARPTLPQRARQLRVLQLLVPVPSLPAPPPLPPPLLLRQRVAHAPSLLHDATRTHTSPRAQDADWIVTSAGGKKFEEVDLSEGEWCAACGTVGVVLLVAPGGVAVAAVHVPLSNSVFFWAVVGHHFPATTYCTHATPPAPPAHRAQGLHGAMAAGRVHL